MTGATASPPRATDAERLARLRTLLQGMPWRAFEAMVPELVGAMIGVRLTAAGSGFQEGADAGTVGRAGRRLRIEAKRYSSNFDARDILGGLRQAIDRDPSLECWIACATRDIPEQLASALERQGAAEGIPVMAIAWDDELSPQLAALSLSTIMAATCSTGVHASSRSCQSSMPIGSIMPPSSKSTTAIADVGADTSPSSPASVARTSRWSGRATPSAGTAPIRRRSSATSRLISWPAPPRRPTP